MNSIFNTGLRTTLFGLVGLLGPSVCAQQQPELTLTSTHAQDHLDVTVGITGTPGTTVALAITANHLIDSPMSTPWGDLYIDSNQATVLFVPLGEDGAHDLLFTIPTSTPQLFGLQALGSDHAGQPTLLSLPAALAAGPGGNSLTYFRGAWTADCTGSHKDSCTVKLIDQTGGKHVLGGGTIPKSKKLTLAGVVRGIPNPKWIVVYRNNTEVQRIRC